ncbi:MAG: DMT family transporter [Candidatus Moranbacteria bacterium]|nr:DMT family transporter [Candidatus Moranbacteria bacterium]
MGIQYAVLFGLIAMVGSGLSSAFSRRPAREMGSDRALFWRQVIMVVLQVPLVMFFFPKDLPWQGLVEAVVIGLIGYLPIYFFFRAISNGRVGVISPISNSSAVITTLLAVYVLGEPFGVFRTFGLVLALVGVVLLSVNFADWKNSALFRKESGIPFAIAACLGWGFILFFIRYPVLLVGPILTAFLVESSVLAISAARLLASRQSCSLPRELRLVALCVGFFSVFGSVAYDAGLMTSSVAVVAILNMTNPVISAGYERFAYGEKLALRQYAGMALAILGAVLVSVL